MLSRPNATNPGSADPRSANPRSAEPAASGRTELIAWSIVERRGAAPVWIRCGIARVNRDGSVNVRLDALPLSGELHLRAAGTQLNRALPVGEPARPARDEDTSPARL